MKRHPHILPRLCALFTLLFAALRLAATPVMPTLSTESEEHWYYISFYNDGTINDKLLGNAGTANGNLTTVAAEVSQANQWKIIAEVVDGTTYYKLVNRASSLYLGYNIDAARYRAVNSGSSDLVKFKLTEGTNGYTLQRNNTDAVNNNWTLDASGGNITTAGIEITDRTDNCELVFLSNLPASDFKYILFAGYGRFGLHANASSSTLEVAAVTGSEADGGGYKWGTVPVAGGGNIYKSDNGYYLKQDGTTGWTVTTLENEATVLTQSQSTYNAAKTRYNLVAADGNGKALCYNGTALVQNNPHTRYSTLNLTTTVTGPTVSPIPGHWYTVQLDLTESISEIHILSDDVSNGGLDNCTLQTISTTANSANVWQIVETPEGCIKLQNKNGYYLYNRTTDLDGNDIGNGGRIFLTDNATLATAFYLEDYDIDYWQLRDPDANSTTAKYLSYNQRADEPNKAKRTRLRHWSAGDPYVRFEFIPIPDADIPSLPAAGISTTNSYTYVQFSGYGKQLLTDAGAGSALTVTSTTYTTSTNETQPGLLWRASHNNDAKYVYISKEGRYLDLTNRQAVTDISNATPLSRTTNSYSQAVTRYNLQNADGQALSFNGTALSAGTPNTRYSLINFPTTLNCPETAPLPGNNYVVGFPAVYGKRLGGDGLDSRELRKNGDDASNATNIWMIEEDATGRFRLKNHNGFYIYNREYVPGTTTLCGEGGRFYLTDNPNVATLFYLEEHLSTATAYWQLRDNQPYGTSPNIYLGPYGSEHADNNLRHQGANDATNMVSFTLHSGAVTAQATDPYQYLQFTGYGKALLKDQGTESSLTVTMTTETAPTGDNGLLWKPSHTDAADYVYVSKLGNYLDATHLKTVADKANATVLSKTTNSYSGAVTRYNLLNAGSQALSYNGTTLSLGSPNTRYSLMNFVTTLTTPDTAPLPGHYYTVQFPSLTPIKKLGGDGIDSKELKQDYTATAANTTNVWQIVEESNGQFKLKNKNGYYLYNRLKNPGTTVNCDMGGRYYLTDNAALASPFYIEEYSTGGYWQLRDPNADYFLYLNPNQPGDNAFTIRHWTADDTHSKVLFEINDVEVPTVGSTAENAYFYLQFSAFGKQLLTDTGAGQPLAVTKVSEETPTDNRYLWRMHHLMGSGVTDGVIVCMSKNGNYLNLSGATPISDTEANATTISFSANDYNGSVSPRYNIVRTDGSALCFDGTNLSMGTSNTRFSVIHRSTTVTGPDNFPLISNATEEHWYSFQWVYLNKVLEMKGIDAPTQFSTDFTPNSSNTWKLVDDGSGNGRYYFMTMNGMYLCDKNGRYYSTTNKSEAAALRIVEYNEGENRSYWQLRNTDETSYQYLNPSGGANATYLENYAANDVVNKVLFTKMEVLPEKTYPIAYLHFSALGQIGAYDKGNDSIPTGKKPDYTTDVANGYLWTVLPKEDGSGVILKSQLGNYLTYNDSEGFKTSTDASKAFVFKLGTNTYENNGSVRNQLLNPANENQALCADYNDHHLYWGVPNTRYSVLWLGSPHIWCTDLPKTSNSLSGFTLYHIRFRSNGYIISSPIEGTVTPIPHDDNMQNMSNAWALYRCQNSEGTYSGDVYLSNGKGLFLKYDAASSSFTSVAGSTVSDIPADATKFRLVENDTRRDCWQLELPEQDSKMLKLLSTTSGETTTYSFVLANQGDAGNYVYFEELNLYPDFSSETTGSWQFIHLDQLDESPRMEAAADGEAAKGSNVTASTSTPDARKTVWKVMGSADDFILKSGTDTYLKVDGTGNVTLTPNKEEAAQLALHFNYFDIDKSTLDWIIEVKGTSPTLYLKYNATESKFVTAEWPATEEESRYFALRFGNSTTPKFSDATSETYYYINFNSYNDPDDDTVKGNLYMSDGVDLTSDAYAEKKQELHNMQWMFKGDKDEVRLMNRNDYYIRWDETSGTFGVTADSTKAAVFNMKLKDRTATGTPYGHFLLTGGEGVSESRLNQYMTITKEGTLYHLTLTTNGIAPDAGQTIVEQVVETKAEDYTQYYIRPKRSWFIKEMNDDKAEHFAGFIEQDPDGSYGFETNPYNGIRQQKTNEYKVIRYMKQGTIRQLDTPTYMRSNANGESKVKAYQRFYDYKTGGRVDPDRINLTEKGRRDYANGTIMGSLLLLNHQDQGYAKTNTIDFIMPKDAPEDYNYVLAVDVSQYTDFIDYFGDNGNEKYNDIICTEVNVPEHQDLIEPTLSERYVYDIHNAHEMAKQLTACTQGSDKWLEEHEIIFPSKKRGFSVSTVPLDNELQNYWFYKNGTHSEENLQNITSYDNIYFEFAENSAGITGFGITEWPVEGATSASADLSKCRFIRFYYPGESSGSYGYGEVATPGSTATILAYARDGGTAGNTGGTLYQLAKITLRFEANCEPLPYTMVMGRTAEGKYKTGRAPEYLRQLTGGAVASIDFNATDFATFRTPPMGKTSTGYNASTELVNTYRYPMLYENSGYNFYPVGGTVYPSTGNLTENSFGSYTVTRRLQVGWGYGNFKPVSHLYKQVYSNYTEAERAAWGIDLSSLNNIDGHAFLYLDASDLPGQIASLRFNSTLCSGSRIYASAWMSSPNGWYGSTPANVLFKVVGHTSSVTATDQPVVLHTYCPGPIASKSCYTDAGGNKAELTHEALTYDDGSQVGVWQQVFFSFVNDAKQSFDHYTLDIENACTSTAGGDILIDDVEVFVSKPTVTVEKTSPVCGREVTLTKMSTSFDDLLSSLGLTEDVTPASGNPKLWFCLVDKAKYDSAMVALQSRSLLEGVSDSEKQAAFDKALVGSPKTSIEEDKAFRYVEISTYYDAIPDFNYSAALGTNTAIVQKETDAGGNRYIVISDKVNSEKLLPNHEYYIVFVPRYGDDPITAANSADQFQMESGCCIRNTFTTLSAVQLTSSNGGKSDGSSEVKVCAGQNVSLTAQIEGVDKTTGEAVEIQVYYDWWLDYKGGTFENIYILPDGTIHKYEKIEDAAASDISLREALITMRHYYPNAVGMEGIVPRKDPEQPVELTKQMIDGLIHALTPEADGLAPLILHELSLNLQIPSSYIGSEGSNRIVTIVPIEFTDENVIYCFEPQHIVMTIEGKAPGMLCGLKDMTYPADFNAPIRTTVQRIEQVRSTTLGTAPATLMRVPLHDLYGVSTIANSLIPVESLPYTPIYICSTNDPNCAVYTPNAQGELIMREVGRLHTLEARLNQGSDYQPYAEIYFNPDFEPHDGYTYSLRFSYQEDQSNVEVCFGGLLFDLKVVPQYLLWNAQAGHSDWTNDLNWKRADKDELRLPDSDGYVRNNESASAGTLQTSHAFVPIDGCHVVIAPADQQPALLGTINSATATPGITLDMVMDAVPEGSNTYLDCREFYTNRCSGLVLQAGTELFNAQLLTYKKAWMEYELDAGRWYTLGSPMKRMYAGDWYAPRSNGRESSPYFRDVTFSTGASGLNDRFSPAVYQRGWDKGTASLYYLTTDLSDPNTSAKKDVAIAADWSSVYNDVQEQYGNGGFSLKALAASKYGSAYTKLLFRLPKEDASYRYYLNGNENGGNAQTVDRSDDQCNKLLTDALKTADSFTQTITNKVTGNQYFLVSNPFPCGLNMTEFFDGNSLLIDQKYWLLTAEGQSAAMKTNAGWITINTSGTPDVLAPGQGFFVKATGSSGTLTLTFKADMMASAKQYSAVLRAPVRRSTAASCPTLRMRTETEAGSSEAVIVKLAEASNDYAAAEDMLTLLDDNLKDVPTVYSLADHQALTVNTRRTMQRVPVGITGGTDGPVQVVFSGLETFGESLSLLDDLTGVVTPLTLNAKPLPGVNELAATVDMQANVANRYFLLSSATPEAEEELTDVKPLVIVNGQKVNITTNAAYPLTYVHIVDAEGRTVFTLTPYTPTLSLKLPMGNYVVEARTATQAVTTKVNIAQ